MRVYHLVLLVAATLLASSKALPALVDQTETSTLTSTERPHQPRSLTSEQKDDAGTRFLRKRHEEENMTSEDDDAEERGAWNNTVKRLKVEAWFHQGKTPEFVRTKLKIPASGVGMTNHKYYKLYENFMKNYNNYKFHRFSPNGQ